VPHPNGIHKRFREDRNVVLYEGDCLDTLRRIPDNFLDLTITSPPYFMGKEYDKSQKLEDFVSSQQEVINEVVRVTKEGGSICWQVGYYAKNSVLVPLDYYVYDILRDQTNVFLRNRIIWKYSHGLHGFTRFSGRHETIMWFTKGKDYFFDLDSVRVPQKYPGKRHYKGPQKGNFSGNPLGKNPSDVWEIPNVKASHVEKTEHPCQFPVALAQRLIRSLSPRGGWILDPYLGSGSSGVAAILEGRRFVGAEIEPKYYAIACDRCKLTLKGQIRTRPLDKPIYVPRNEAVAQKPENFLPQLNKIHQNQKGHVRTDG